MKLALSVAMLGVISSASWLARAQPPASQPPPTSPPPPIYYPGTTAEPPSASWSRSTSLEAIEPAPKRIAAPQNALELSFGTGYTQGFGSLSGGVGFPSVISAGVGFDIGIGYRINARWGVLWTGGYQEFTPERSDAAGGVTSSVSVQYHFAPTHQIDPWVDLGAGYRLLWEIPVFGPTLQSHGLQLARVRVGLDIRVDEQIALGPVIGADATIFRWQDVPYFSDYIDDQRVSTFIFAGLQGRFDFGARPSSYEYAKR